MERVKEGKWYWYVSINCEGVSVNSKIDTYCVLDNKNFESNVYFHTKEEAESMANKLRAVLDGADVIEMPSDEDFYDEEFKTNHYFFAKYGAIVVGAHQIGFKHCYDWLKSKIVK